VPEPSGAGGQRTRGAGSGAAGGASTGRGGLVTGGGSTPDTETPVAGGARGAANTGGANTGAAGRATITGAGVVSTPIGAAATTTPARGIDTTKVLDNIPPNPRDTSTIQPSRAQGQLTPSARDQQPIPFSGAKPSPRDSAMKAKTGQKPDTVKPPEE
jgi:hypothetical protein